MASTKRIKFLYGEEKIIETFDFDAVEHRLGMLSGPLNDHQLFRRKALACGTERRPHGMLFLLCVS